ncbi:MAG: lactate utilization protein [Rhodospirillaceae bacterium]
MSAREDILGRVRAALGRGEGAGPPPMPDHASAPLVPARGRGSPSECAARFVTMAEESSASVARVAAREDVAQEIARFLAASNLPPRLVRAPDAALDACGWHRAPGLVLRQGRAETDDAVSVTPAFAGIAETGSLMVASGPATPYSLNFLPATHIAVLDAARIVGAFEDAWALIRPNGETAAALPRTVTLITGPSRSSDIERTVTIGVHGPRRLHIVVVGRADGEAA